MRQPTNPYKNSPNAVPPAIERHNHLIPLANRLLAATAKKAWKGVKLLARIAFFVPRAFVRVNHRPPKKKE